MLGRGLWGWGHPPAQPQHLHPFPKGSQLKVSYSFHFVSKFALINPPRSQSPLTNIIGKIQGDGGAMGQSQPGAAPTPAPSDLCCTGAAGVPASLCPQLYG